MKKLINGFMEVLNWARKDLKNLAEQIGEFSKELNNKQEQRIKNYTLLLFEAMDEMEEKLNRLFSWEKFYNEYMSCKGQELEDYKETLNTAINDLRDLKIWPITEEEQDFNNEIERIINNIYKTFKKEDLNNGEQ